MTMTCETTWQSGFIFELGSDGFGYIVNDVEPADSHPFSISTMEKTKVKKHSLEGASVRYQLIGQRIAKVELAPAASSR